MLPLCTVNFHEHSYTYKVTMATQNFVVFDVNHLRYPWPFGIQMSYEANDTTFCCPILLSLVNIIVFCSEDDSQCKIDYSIMLSIVTVN